METKKTILLLGSGLMAESVIDHLLKRNEVDFKFYR
jgi:hypothetical protein